MVADKPPLALSLTYLRHLAGKDIADRSIVEIRKQGFTDEAKLGDWRGQLRAIMPDVKEGTTLTGVLTATGQTEFCRNGSRIGTIRDPDFGPRFFDIWLGPKTSAPGLRAKLLPTFR